MKSTFIIILSYIISLGQIPEHYTTNQCSLNDEKCLDKLSDNEMVVNLKRQLISYHNALLSGLGDEAFGYCIPEMIIYFEKEFPEYNENEIKDFLVRDTARKFKETMERFNLKYNFEISTLKKKSKTEDSLIAYEILTYLHVIKDMKEMSSGDKIIAISLDGGYNWKFIQKSNSLTRYILLMKYKRELVDRILE